MLSTLQKNVDQRELLIKDAKAQLAQSEPWISYFREICKILEDKQHDAIESFTKEYGPRTSVIQRRLRTVYGFDQIDISSQGTTIQVRASRNGVQLRPVDYFSQSQQQTLLLGLFLTACSSQSWSALSPVFLDDPVTHFDDLNTYSFLDLIIGLLKSEGGGRQFIISTCDERLLLLAREKFRHLGARAKYYKFMAIGSLGPTVVEIT